MKFQVSYLRRYTYELEAHSLEEMAARMDRFKKMYQENQIVMLRIDPIVEKKEEKT
jgi:ribosomal protein L21E